MFFKTSSKENAIGETPPGSSQHTPTNRVLTTRRLKRKSNKADFFYFPLWIFFLLFILCGGANSIGITSLHRHIYLLSKEKHLCLLKLFLLDLVFAGSKEFCLACKVNTNTFDRSITFEYPQSVLVDLVKVTYIYTYIYIYVHCLLR